MDTIRKTEELPMGVCVLVDGGCLNNNKPVTERHMYGTLTVFCDRTQVASTWFVQQVETKQLKHRFELGMSEDGHASNNLAELMMLDYALSYLAELKARATGRTMPTITIITDSEWAMNVMTGDYHLKASSHQSLKSYADMVKGNFQHNRYNVRHADNVWVKSILGHQNGAVGDWENQLPTTFFRWGWGGRHDTVPLFRPPMYRVRLKIGSKIPHFGSGECKRDDLSNPQEWWENRVR